MQYVQALFSLKFEPIIKIRREVNNIEDKLEEFYLPPQMTSLPDDFAADAPRIILNSKGGHSQISFSQYSVDLTANFDGEYVYSFEKTKEYVLKRINLLKDLMQELNRNSFYFFGITYNVRLDTQGKNGTEYMRDFLDFKVSDDDVLYEASRRTAFVEEDRFFVNEQIGTFREYQSNGNSSMDLINLVENKIVSEGINLSLDVNNRYAYLIHGGDTSFETFDDNLVKIFNKIEFNLKKWE